MKNFSITFSCTILYYYLTDNTGYYYRNSIVAPASPSFPIIYLYTATDPTGSVS